jgi:hypothetical protein
VCKTGPVQKTRYVDIQKLQNRLSQYRHSHSGDVIACNFDAPTLPPRVRPVASALCSCIVGVPHLQTELITLLAHADTQQQADRADTLEAMCIEAILQGKQKVYVSEVAHEVDRIRRDRGETSTLSAEKIGYGLKMSGLRTLRLDKAGNGIIPDYATLNLVRDLELAYFGVGLSAAGT